MIKIGMVCRMVLLSALVFNGGCAHCNASEPEKMYTLGSALTKLTSAVEAKVLFKEAPPNLADMDLINLSVVHDTRLKEPFSEYVLKAKSINGHAVVLVCDQSGRKGLLEDGGCSSVIDQHWWREKGNHPCEVSNSICMRDSLPR